MEVFGTIDLGLAENTEDSSQCVGSASLCSSRKGTYSTSLGSTVVTSFKPHKVPFFFTIHIGCLRKRNTAQGHRS